MHKLRVKSGPLRAIKPIEKYHGSHRLSAKWSQILSVLMLKGWINLGAIYSLLVLCLSNQIMKGVNKPYTHKMKLKYLNSHTF